MNIFISKKPRKYGGGSNSFISLFNKWIKRSPHSIVNNPKKADFAIIIAHFAEENELINLKKRGCFLVHRLDEYFDENENPNRVEKHKKLIRLNAHMDVTVFQSNFVYDNVYSFLKPRKFKIIHNGGDPGVFCFSQKSDGYIGHVSWSIGKRKRLDILQDFILTHPDEKFLLIGRHSESPYNFKLPNVKVVGKVKRDKISHFFRKMKMLYFPSENDPCPNTVIEAILSGVPVCYNPLGGTVELVNGPVIGYSNILPDTPGIMNKEPGQKIICGLPLNDVSSLLDNLDLYKTNCMKRRDLHFHRVFQSYMDIIHESKIAL